MPARFAPDPPPCIRRSWLRIPKFAAHSEPAYVVGTETTGRPVATETAFVRSIALPPPTASSPSAPSAAAAISSIRWLGTSLHRPTAGSSSSDQRSLAIRNGLSIPSSPRRPGSSRRPQRMITPPPPPPTPLRPCSWGLAAAPRSRRPHRQSRRGLFDGIASDASRRELGSRKVDERLGGARRRPSGRADERDLTDGLMALDPGRAQRARRELGLDARARDEGDAEAGGNRALHGLLQPELEPDIEIAQAERAAT